MMLFQRYLTFYSEFNWMVVEGKLYVNTNWYTPRHDSQTAINYLMLMLKPYMPYADF